MELAENLSGVERVKINPDQGNDFSDRMENVKSTLKEMGNISELLSNDGTKIAEMTKLFEIEQEKRAGLILKSLEEGNVNEADQHMEELENIARKVRSIIEQAMELTVNYLKLQSEFRVGLHRK